ncbi:M15 family metallopeptidase [Aquibacillus koreensis]|uniref:M15 family metallopeptidase n=1 Tax=Aquibacillus koreensis TaxID=279446 RepID=A0A9X3WJS0_9BACI|nr:M15 family metallopeptidase [Aquibacillus koreensis]MCT2535537.1 M15 family metallopeptidase [Aquibacillus koreensis]MDC3420178.1 M15 family metallopeptidase [Aquibacillus koreensis]
MHLLVFILISVVLFGCQQDEQSMNEVKNKQASVDDKEEMEVNEQEQVDQPEEQQQEETDKEEETETTNQETNENNNETTNNGLTVVDNPDSIEVFVNKQRKLPDGWNPKNLVVPNVPFYFDENLPKKQMRQEAATALEQLFQAAEEEGLALVAASGYRSYERQKTIYEHNVNTNGQAHADQFSAKPGTSEHQTGLAMDVTTAEVAFALEQSFKQTNEGSWLAENAHQFGFIIRYPEGKSDITGYAYEPWHLRYVGTEIAQEIYERSITLEEYFGFGY